MSLKRSRRAGKSCLKSWKSRQRAGKNRRPGKIAEELEKVATEPENSNSRHVLWLISEVQNLPLFFLDRSKQQNQILTKSKQLHYISQKKKPENHPKTAVPPYLMFPIALHMAHTFRHGMDGVSTFIVNDDDSFFTHFHI